MTDLSGGLHTSHPLSILGILMLIKYRYLSLVIGLLTSSITSIAAELNPAIDAQFETTHCASPCKTAHVNSWWLLRSADQVELRNIDKTTGTLSARSEIWKHNPDGKLSYLYLMHPDKRAIEYLFDDLKILGLGADEQKWQMSSQLLTNDELAHMKKTDIKTAPYQGFDTESYEGEINQAKVNVLWIPKLHIPAKVIYTYPTSTATVALQKLITGSELTSNDNLQLKTTNEALSSYQQVYFTDIGDMEQNAEAQVWIAKAKGAPGLNGHHH
jgi:hypothetical protein